MSYSVRRVDDTLSVLVLNEEIFPTDPLEIDEKTVAWVIFDSNKKLAGFCTARMLEDNIIYFDRGGILEGHRGNKLHRRLLKVRECFAKKNGFKEIITYVVKDNLESLCTLIRHDYKIYNPEFEYAGKSREEVIYLLKEI